VTVHVGQYFMQVGQTFVTVAKIPLQIGRRHLSKILHVEGGKDVPICKKSGSQKTSCNDKKHSLWLCAAMFTHTHTE